MNDGWAAALEAAARAPVTLVLGANDTGKSTLVTRLAGALAAAGHAVGVVDADLGQSDVGPPTTVGLGLVRGGLQCLGEAEVAALEFLGVTSPATCMQQTADATGRLVRRARERGCDRVLVNTSGLVEGALGRALKRLKIERVAPDVLVVLQRSAECEPILDACGQAEPPAVVRLPAAPTARRSATARRHARRRALEAHLKGAASVTLDLARVVAWPAAVVRGLAVIEVEGALVGLATSEGCTLGLGWVRGLDTATMRLTVDTCVEPDRIAAVTIGRERYSAA